MNKSNITLVLILIVTFTGFSQLSHNEHKVIKITETEEFFQKLHAQNEPPQRGEFETPEEYKKRLPKPFDSKKIVYLRIKESLLDKLYTYDIESGRLTFTSGKLKPIEDKPPKGTPIVIFYKIDTKETEVGNGRDDGGTVTIKETYWDNYILNFTNLDAVPDSIFDRDQYIFKLAINKPPKEAERLSKRVHLVIGVIPIASSYSSFSHKSEPYWASPYDWTYYHDMMINVQFISLLLYDDISKKIILPNENSNDYTFGETKKDEKRETQNYTRKTSSFIKDDCLAATTLSMLLKAEGIANRGDEEALQKYMLSHYPYTMVLKRGGKVKVLDSTSKEYFVKVQVPEDGSTYWIEKNMLE